MRRHNRSELLLALARCVSSRSRLQRREPVLPLIVSIASRRAHSWMAAHTSLAHRRLVVAQQILEQWLWVIFHLPEQPLSLLLFVVPLCDIERCLCILQPLQLLYVFVHQLSFLNTLPLALDRRDATGPFARTQSIAVMRNRN